MKSHCHPKLDLPAVNGGWSRVKQCKMRLDSARPRRSCKYTSAGIADTEISLECGSCNSRTTAPILKLCSAAPIQSITGRGQSAMPSVAHLGNTVSSAIAGLPCIQSRIYEVKFADNRQDAQSGTLPEVLNEPNVRSASMPAGL